MNSQNARLSAKSHPTERHDGILTIVTLAREGICLSGQLISIAGLSGWLLPLALSPLIDTNSEFFFGTGDGSVGYYAERPNQ